MRLTHFTQGLFCFRPGDYVMQIRRTAGGVFARLPGLENAFDWYQDDGRKQDLRMKGRLSEHPLLQRAFACNPPERCMSIEVAEMWTDVNNDDGVTVLDVVHALSKL